MFDPDLWLRQQLWEQLWKGPGAVSTYWSIAIQLACVGLSALGSTELQGPNLWILSIVILLGVLLILSDEIASCRNHRLGLLRFSAAKSRDRIEKLGIKSKQVDRFLNALWLNRELEFSFKNTRLQSVVLMVLALDLLSRMASRYGRCGRKVFEANQDPIVSAMQLFECVPFADADKILVEPLRAWLKTSPEIQKVGHYLFLESFDLPFPVTDRGRHRRDRSSCCTTENRRCRFPVRRWTDPASCETTGL
jgi:hypothetical protein